eukprot:TRINITY_DN1220_c0_g1_i2.p1 TRINITY_DN1220_c0_g1~~TRINITY_DN1220_c0_g1_i2.p1  ORF type:complete len:440 (-),score=66.65 TRINITY_DN1220_c0_g1_i2:54-1373(-)
MVDNNTKTPLPTSTPPTPGSSSVATQKHKKQQGEWYFGDQVPFGDPAWYQGSKSPFYNDSHRVWRAKVRAFVDKEIVPHITEWENNHDYPRELHEKAYAAGVLSPLFPKKYGGQPPEGFDSFHDLIWIDEVSRSGCGGVGISVFFIPTMALPPVLYFGSDYLKEKVCRDVITGKKVIALAVTEPFAGSDVAGIRTTARREGDFWIVNGQKKFITAGTKADFFTTAVRTGGEGMGGISLLLVERNMPGVTIRRLPTQGWYTSGTTHIIMEDVKVPVANMIGQENQGFRIIMTNFNHERFTGCVGSLRGARCCLEEAVKYARLRNTFGQRLADHQVIRQKIAEMARQVESTFALIESITFQMNSDPTARTLGGILALAKVQSTKTFEYCAREASQILGGNSYLQSGVGEKVERLYREVRVNAIGGGSEEVLLDLAMRQAKI